MCEGNAPSKAFSFPGEKKLRVCKTLGTFLSKRESWGNQESQVLVSFVKSDKVVISSSVSRWLKNGLSMAGIDTRISKGQ